MSNAIEKINESVKKLHGGDREQAAKRRAYLDFLRQQRIEQEKTREH